MRNADLIVIDVREDSAEDRELTSLNRWRSSPADPPGSTYVKGGSGRFTSSREGEGERLSEAIAAYVGLGVRRVPGILMRRSCHMVRTAILHRHPATVVSRKAA